MIVTNPPVQTVKRKAVTKTKTYNEKGQLVSEETYEETEYFDTKPPMYPYTIINGTTTTVAGQSNYKDHTHLSDDLV